MGCVALDEVATATGADPARYVFVGAGAGVTDFPMSRPLPKAAKAALKWLGLEAAGLPSRGEDWLLLESA